MNSTINHIVHHLFKKQALDEVDQHQLEKFVADHPYFALGHLLLAKKLAANRDEPFENALAKTALYFNNNSLWLNWLINEKYLPANAIEDGSKIENFTAAATFTSADEIMNENDAEGKEMITVQETATEKTIYQPEGNLLKEKEEEPGVTGQEDLVLESYHTIDYFASQGIRLQLEELTKDKLGQQLKSFTEWLRSMKRLPQSSAETNIDDVTQQSIRKIAEHSIEEKEVVTEAMAEVWLKQGNKEKATEIYDKLSLLNPDKSHYFAAKIEHLKGL
jgi:hypothetical protein